VQFAKALELKVIGVNARDEGLKLMKDAGAGILVDVHKGQESAVGEVKRVTGGQGIAAIVNTSDAEKAAAMSCAITHLHGTVGQLTQVYGLFFF